MLLIDTHCHLNDPEAFPDPASAVEEARANGVERLVAIGVSMESSRRAVGLAEQFDEVYATVGWHPNYTADYTPSALPIFAELLRHPKVVGLGEVGLDRYWDFATMEQQNRALQDQLALAEEMRCPVVFHCREAYADLLAVLPGFNLDRFVLHCFSGSVDDAAALREMGAMFGVDGPITYPKSSELRDIVEGLPRDRVVIETDSPYMSPVPHRGKPNRPAWVSLINAKLAEVWGVSPDESAAITSANARVLFPKLA